MIRTKNQTEALLLSITKNCETLIEQTHTKPEETLEFKYKQFKTNISSQSTDID